MDNFIKHRPAKGSPLLALFLSAAIGALSPVWANAEFQRHYELGKDFLQRQEYKLAIQELDIAAVKPAKPAELSAALVDRGTAYSELKNYKAALTDFDRAITLDGTSHLAYNNRGVVYLRQGIADKAIANFDKALALDNEDKYAVVNRAGAFLMTDKAASFAPATEQWLKKNNWHSDFAAQAAVLTVLAYLAGGESAHAKSLNATALEALDKLHWPYQMLNYLAGKCSQDKVVEVAEDSTYDLTQAQCYLGIEAYIKGKTKYDVAKNKFDFVVRHGTTNSVEYWIGKFIIAKIAPDSSNQKGLGKVPSTGQSKIQPNGQTNVQPNGQPKVQPNGQSKAQHDGLAKSQPNADNKREIHSKPGAPGKTGH